MNEKYLFKSGNLKKPKKERLIELVNKLEKPYDEIHNILDELQEYWEVCEPASDASNLLSIMMRIIIEQIEKKVRPELYGISTRKDQ